MARSPVRKSREAPVVYESEYRYILPGPRNIARRASDRYGHAYDAAYESALNQQGTEGWELVEVRPDDEMHVFRRVCRGGMSMPETTTEWEYLCPVISVASPVHSAVHEEDELAPEAADPFDVALQEVLNRLGTAGWELVGIRHRYNTWVLKRQKRSGASVNGASASV